MSFDDVAKKKMWYLEKFLPIECPKCRQAFKAEGVDYSLLFGDIVDGQKTVRETKGYNIIICSKCRNFTARFPLESWQVGDAQRAQELVREGFVNLGEVVGYGNHTQDHHVVYAQLPAVHVQGIVIE